ncbi:MAG: hypothetical protein ACKO3T_00845 [Planctomycetaceae bacterium]
MSQNSLKVAFRWRMLAAMLAGAATSMLGGSVLQAQVVKAPLNEGFVRTSSIAMTVDEMLGVRKVRGANEPILGPGYPALWIGEVQFKPLRLMRLNWTDAATGEARQEIVRYMVYRVIRRDYTDLAGAEKSALELKLADPNTDPAILLDPETSNPLQMPRFLLQAQELDGSVTASWQDEVSVAIQNAVFAREMGRRGRDLKLLNSVEALQEVGPPVAADDADALSKAFYGVAVWRNVDDKADYFTVSMSGFSNAYRISKDAQGQSVYEEKVIVQKFERPGDEFLQEEIEFRLVDQGDTDGDGKADVRYPLWQYRARQFATQIPNLDLILRNISTSAPAAQN